MNMKEKLESLGKNSIQLKIARKETYKLGATRFGGKPDVPPDFVWPTYEDESYDHVVKDRPLTFLAQFNCEELAQFDKEHLLPDHGLLSFFYETAVSYTHLIIATTIDKEGLNYTKNIIEQYGLSDRIETKLEDISEKMPYNDEFFDFVYARLVLHYLDNENLTNALKEIKRVMKKHGRLYLSLIHIYFRRSSK